MSISASQSVSSSAGLQVANKQLTTAGQTEGQSFKKILANQNAQKTTTKQQKITIRWGDTVSELAEKYRTTTAAITGANHLQNPDFILAGNNLVIPGHNVQTAAVKNTKETTPSTAAINTKYSSQAVTNKESSTEAQARAYIVAHESGGNYNARNGKYIGKYQLDSSYLNGDYSPANQERVANRYVAQRYGSWASAMQHWKANNWY
ncbi:LysM peptidoglycan-binding domain-containing protein [Liquorilactobacillus capillatus]|uniref:Peptidoglycan-binding protein n=1 Tax=Liquorilactobacillus capillatus DSM 19910 TaxID=1423731 RepID=A0A0R1M1X1_9LACO|nr:LysM peptidoglycan-binding domain-containing protein [Liquorilactobacillus capillatus]KRL01991.1 peptidoglycan-binding protein [Liquorilactobacillus capillatus DSM 19910]